VSAVLTVRGVAAVIERVGVFGLGIWHSGRVWGVLCLFSDIPKRSVFTEQMGCYTSAIHGYSLNGVRDALYRGTDTNRPQE